MRIGIVTMTLRYNYGGILQAWALQNILTQLGHDAYVFDFVVRKYPPLWKMPLLYGYRLLLNLEGHKFPIFFEKKYYNEDKVLRQNVRKFIDRNIKLLPCNSLRDIKQGDFDAFVVGSDQVWRPEYFLGRHNKDAFLAFTNGWNVKRISYAASFGKDDISWPKRRINECSKCLKKFDAVSVREDSGVKICREKFGVDAVHVLDPTLLHSKEEYIKLIQTADTPKSPGNLHCYILDETDDKTKLIDVISKQRGLTPFRVNSKVESHNVKLEERVQPPVEKWLRAFYDSDFVVTDSFHACVFSLIFNKQFVVYANKDRGLTRYFSLLKPLGLENRIIYSAADYSDLEEIDYEIINKKIQTMRNESMDFIKRALAN